MLTVSAETTTATRRLGRPRGFVSIAALDRGGDRTCVRELGDLSRHAALSTARWSSPLPAVTRAMAAARRFRRA